MDMYIKVKQVETTTGRYGVTVLDSAEHDIKCFTADELFYVGLAEVYVGPDVLFEGIPVLEDCYVGNIWIEYKDKV